VDAWEAFLGLSWRLYPVLALAALAVALVARGCATLDRSRRESRDPDRALLVARGFRTGILGLCIGVFAGAWLYGVGWLALVALIVVGEEMFETSVMVGALEDGRRTRKRPRACALCAQDALRRSEGWSRIDVACQNRPSTFSSSAAGPVATSPRSAPPSSASRPQSSSASTWAGSA
jgi:hypothetical protein